MLKQGRPMGQQFIQAPIEVILGRQRKIFSQQISHGALCKPVLVQPPLTARFNQPITHQGLQHMTPVGALPTGRQPRNPKLLQLQLFPQLVGDPAGAPLTWLMEAKLRELNLGKLPWF